MPKNQGKNGTAVDDGALYDSTVGSGVSSASVSVPAEDGKLSITLFLPLITH
ncbi:MAG: hypothetical protein R3C14_45435 [Caldilineaceae bacterium]